MLLRVAFVGGDTFAAGVEDGVETDDCGWELECGAFWVGRIGEGFCVGVLKWIDCGGVTVGEAFFGSGSVWNQLFILQD